MWKSLGKITLTSANTMYRLTVNESDPTARKLVHALCVEQVPGNTGNLYVFLGNTGTISNLTGCVGILPIPTDNSLATVAADGDSAPNPFDASQYYVMSETASQVALGIYIES